MQVPSCYTQQQRALFNDAARLAGIKPLQLIDEMTAVALTYGMYHVKTLPPVEAEPRKVGCLSAREITALNVQVMFVDMGHSQAQIAIADFNEGNVVVRIRVSCID